VTRIKMIKTAAFVLIASSAAAIANPPQGTPNPQQPLIDATHALAQSVTLPAASPGDVDQGDDHASARAILIVCNHDNPSAQRSAICPSPNSPP